MFWIKPPIRFKFYLGKEAVWNIKTDEKVIYLTFDDGPHPSTTPFILDLLEAYGFTATFFCLGKSVEKYPALFESIKSKGHAVGNHTYDHLNAWSLVNTEKYMQNVEKANKLIQSNLFRPPYGKLYYTEWNQLKKDYTVVMWSLMPEDFKPKLSSEKVLSRLEKNIGSRNIVVLHENDKSIKHCKYLLPRYLSLLNSKGYQVKKLPC